MGRAGTFERGQRRTRWGRDLISAVGKSAPGCPTLRYPHPRPKQIPRSHFPNIALWGFSCGRRSSVIFEQLIDYRRRNPLFTGGRKEGEQPTHRLPTRKRAIPVQREREKETEKRELARSFFVILPSSSSSHPFEPDRHRRRGQMNGKGPPAVN